MNVLQKEYGQLYGLDKKKQLEFANAPMLLITPFDLAKVRKRISDSKAVSDNLVTASSLHNNWNLIWIALKMTGITQLRFPSQIFFQSRMCFFNKEMDVTFASIGDCRPITITTTE